MIAATGWTFEYMDDVMTLPRLFALTSSWSVLPPIHKMVASYLGMGKKKEEAAVQQDFSVLSGVDGFQIG